MNKLPQASATKSGIVTTGTQSLAGDKTIIGNLTVDPGQLNIKGGTDSYVSLWETSVERWRLQSTGSTNGFDFIYQAGGITPGGISAAGAWTFGPSVTSASSSGQAHILSGGINAGGTGTSDDQRGIILNANGYHSTYATNFRTRSTGIGGNFIQLHGRTDNTFDAITFWVNQVADGATTNADIAGYITQNGAWNIGSSATTGAHVVRTSSAAESTDGLFSIVNNCLFESASGSAPAISGPLRISKLTSTSRSINASGTVNANGSDYAEYMFKDIPAETIPPGSVCGIKSNGKLTTKFSESIKFMVKSTNPSFIGGDDWANLEPLPDETDADRKARVEAERYKVDRIAFCGQVPCLVAGSFSEGDWIIPQQLGEDSIEAVAVSDATITFEQYRKALGQVIKIIDSSTALIIVGVK